MNESKNFAIVVAGGQGLRMGSKIKKQYLHLGGIPILSRTIMAFDKSDHVHGIVLVVPIEDMDYCKTHIVNPFGFKKKIYWVNSGEERPQSVLNGLKHIQDNMSLDDDPVVLIHDGVRPFIDPFMIYECIQKTMEYGACIPGLKITDTVKRVFSDRVVQKTLNRDTLYQAQTPQCFRLRLIMSAFAHAATSCFSGTDDASFLEHFGHKVIMIEGSKLNIKITTTDDLALGEYFLSKAYVKSFNDSEFPCK